jgi:deazaflavin-dependent oxidoreductase (nitroreductase family)
MAAPEPADPARDVLGEELATWGKVALLETRGRVSGRPLRTAVNFVEEPDGSLLVAAGEPDADWALNLLADPTATATVAERTGRYRTFELDGPERSAAIASLILRYGTPAERLGRGPAVRLLPIGREPGA